MALARHDQLPAARQALQAETKRRATSADALTLVAQAWLQIGDFASAEEACRQALVLEPQRVDARFSQAMALQTLGSPGEAREIYRQLLREQPQLFAAANNLAWLLASDPTSDASGRAEALELATKICAATGQANASFLDTLALTQAASGDWPAAERTAALGVQVARSRGESQLAAKLERRLQAVRRQQLER
jgi:tetratricopeptide (TPR) repeat protein